MIYQIFPNDVYIGEIIDAAKSFRSVFHYHFLVFDRLLINSRVSQDPNLGDNFSYVQVFSPLPSLAIFITPIVLCVE